MAYAIDWKKVVLLAALLLAPLALTNCGSAEDNAASSTVGPAGPTYPSKLYFDLTAVNSVVQQTSAATFTVRVWDSAGNMASDVFVTLNGSSSYTDLTTASGIVSYGGFSWTGASDIYVACGAGIITVVYVTATVEDLSLTVPVQIIATGKQNC